MGVLYQDDISQEQLAKEDAYTLEITKFDSDADGNTKIRKSKKFYVSLSSLRKTFGDTSFGWSTLIKNADGKWVRKEGN